MKQHTIEDLIGAGISAILVLAIFSCICFVLISILASTIKPSTKQQLDTLTNVITNIAPDVKVNMVNNSLVIFRGDNSYFIKDSDKGFVLEILAK